MFSEFRAVTYVIAFVTATVVAYLVTPVVCRIAARVGFVDRPGGRKVQAKPVALGGGVAVFAAMAAAATLAYLVADSILPLVFRNDDPRLLAGLGVAAISTLILGLYDDAVGMKGRYKLLAQLVICGLLVYLGMRIDRFGAFGQSYQLGWVAIPVTIFWLVGSTNAINLLDGIDGLASSVGVVICLTLAAINGLYDHFAEAVLMLALAGALLGFLRHNFAPASIYLGDAGSMVIGLLVGAVAVMTHAKTPAFVAMAIPLAVWSIPVLDSAAAIMRRRLTGRSIFDPDRGHLHHSLLDRGWSVPQAALFIALVCATTCLSAVLSVLWKNELIAIFTVLGVIAFLVSTKTFGHNEFALLRDRVDLSGVGLSRTTDAHGAGRRQRIRLQGSHAWEEMWDALVESAEDHRLLRLRITLHLPGLNESFYASWKAAAKLPPKSETWHTAHPLRIDGAVIGRLEVIGNCDDPGRSTLNQTAETLDYLEPIEDRIRELRDRIALEKKQRSEAETIVAPTGAAPPKGTDPAGPHHAKTGPLSPPAPTLESTS
ncbi:WecA-like glycosyltransferase [Pseudobythopirellula maris]|uniref:WecA-like glycosyltransferase n=1 Tax=Pseudobythopirellula maris TaxID=2527991 RepID=A0A5C5ZNY0_9BACT|nr:MraY family glycosyltransferase [Pseudobythopirellula maris]TWT88846.1 WecA-like glycosyltransferase [Pseudobythopirellula maris]